MNTESIRMRLHRARLALLGLGVAISMISTSTMLAAVPVLSVTVGDIELRPDTSGQTVDLWIANTGDAPLEARGMNLRIQLGDGTGADGAPSLMNVDAVTGTPWEGKVVAEMPIASDPQYWDLRLFCSLFEDAEVAVLGPDSLTRLAQLHFDTTGWTSGSWSLRLAGMSTSLGDPYTASTDYSTVDGQLAPMVINGQVIVVPEPGEWGMLGMGAAFAWVLWHRRRLRHAW
jgi:hypothetical protein